MIGSRKSYAVKVLDDGILLESLNVSRVYEIN